MRHKKMQPDERAASKGTHTHLTVNINGGPHDLHRDIKSRP